MTDERDVDEGSLVWAGAIVAGIDPTRLLGVVDVAALAAIVAEAEVEDDPIDVAAALVVETVRRRPFPASNTAIGWLAAVERLAESKIRLRVDPAAVVELCAAIRRGDARRRDVAAALRTWVIEEGIACPACGRRVYAEDPLARRLVPPVGARFELTARCAYEHGHHDRSGRPVATAAQRPSDSKQPILATGDCGSVLLADRSGVLVVSPFCDDPPLVRVVEVDDPSAGDLVGRWDPLVERSAPLGVVPADDAAPDECGRIDVSHLRRALGVGRRRSPGAAERRVEIQDARTP